MTVLDRYRDALRDQQRRRDRRVYLCGYISGGATAAAALWLVGPAGFLVWSVLCVVLALVVDHQKP